MTSTSPMTSRVDLPAAGRYRPGTDHAQLAFGTRHLVGPRAARRILARVVAVTALGVALAACTNSSDPLGSVAAGPATGEAATLEAADGNRFTPATLELPAGEQVTIEITNTDDAAHDFAIEAADLNTGTIQGGAVATATFTVPEGTTEFVCTFHRGMTGTIQGIAQGQG